MPGIRIKGQEVVVQFIRSGDVVKEMPASDFEAEFQFDRLQEGYQGETTDRFDDVFKGITGRMTLHMEDTDPLDLLMDLKDRARRRLAHFKVHVTATFSFPGTGAVKRLLFADIYFANVPLSSPNRSDFITMTLDWGCSDATVV